MNDRPHRVVGVLPNVPHYPQENDVYMPVVALPRVMPMPESDLPEQSDEKAAV